MLTIEQAKALKPTTKLWSVVDHGHNPEYYARFTIRPEGVVVAAGENGILWVDLYDGRTHFLDFAQDEAMRKLDNPRSSVPAGRYRSPLAYWVTSEAEAQELANKWNHETREAKRNV